MTTSKPELLDACAIRDSSRPFRAKWKTFDRGSCWETERNTRLGWWLFLLNVRRVKIETSVAERIRKPMSRLRSVNMIPRARLQFPVRKIVATGNLTFPKSADGDFLTENAQVPSWGAGIAADFPIGP